MAILVLAFDTTLVEQMLPSGMLSSGITSCWWLVILLTNITRSDQPLFQQRYTVNTAAQVTTARCSNDRSWKELKHSHWVFLK